MPVREFLRGGYKASNDMIVVTNHGRPIGTWIPSGRDQFVRRDHPLLDRRTEKQ